MKYSDIFKDRAQTSILQIYDMKSGGTEEIARFPYVIEAPLYSRDGKNMYYNAGGKIYNLDLESLESRQIETGMANTCNNDHVLGPDNTMMGVSSGEDDDMNSYIYLVDLENGKVSKVVTETLSYLHGISPDGRKIAYCAARNCGAPELEWDVYEADIDGGNERRLTSSYGLNDGPEYSPDGKTIWFNSVRSGRMQIWKMNADGSGQTQMTFDHKMNSWFGHVSPDGKWVVYISYHQGDLLPGDHVPDKNVEIRMISAEGSEEKTLVKLFGGQGTMNVNSWAPDSSKFAFVSYSFDEELAG